jgi:rhodanese-related sulfurtransferase
VPELPAIEIDQLADRLADGAPLLDVRRPDEYEEFHVPGARLIPLDEFIDRLDEVPTDRTVYVICRTGSRSAKAAEFLVANGYDAVNVTGGSLGWAEAGHPVEHGS